MVACVVCASFTLRKGFVRGPWCLLRRQRKRAAAKLIWAGGQINKSCLGSGVASQVARGRVVYKKRE